MCEDRRYGIVSVQGQCFHTLRPRLNGHQFADNIFKLIAVYENCCVFIKISLKFGAKGPIDNMPALLEFMAMHRLGDKTVIWTKDSLVYSHTHTRTRKCMRTRTRTRAHAHAHEQHTTHIYRYLASMS